MNPLQRAIALPLFTLATVLTSTAHAGPGAHGPDGQHLDTPNAAIASSMQPRLEAHSELFELVATLYEDELSILIDDYATNAAIREAQVEVESGELKATATFHADHGDFSIDDPVLVKALWQPGAHPLVVTVITPTASDLLDGTLQVGASASAAAHDHDDAGHSHLLRYLLAAAVGAALLYAALRWRQSRGQQ